MRKASLLFLLASLGALVAACSRTGEPSKVADVCQKGDGAIVAVEGFLVLPTFTQTTIDKKTEMTTYELSLAEGPDAEGAAIKTAVMGTRSNKTNRINELPSDGYTKRDLQIFTDAGETISSLERVRVTGEMLKSGNGEPIAKPCILKVEKIERP